MSKYILEQMIQKQQNIFIESMMSDCDTDKLSNALQASREYCQNLKGISSGFAKISVLLLMVLMQGVAFAQNTTASNNINHLITYAEKQNIEIINWATEKDFYDFSTQQLSSIKSKEGWENFIQRIAKNWFRSENNNGVQYILLPKGKAFQPAKGLEPISEEFSGFIAESYGKRLHKNLALVSTFKYLDAETNLPNVYVNLMQKNSKDTTDFATLNKKIAIAYQEIQSIESKINELKSKGNLSQGEDNHLRTLQRKKRSIQRNDLQMKDDFLTIIVSANKGSDPIVQSYQGLPHHLHKRPRLEEKLKTQSQFANLDLVDKVYFVDKSAHYFAFKDSVNQSSDLQFLRIGDNKLSPSSIVGNRVQKAKQSMDVKKYEKKWRYYQLLQKRYALSEHKEGLR